jgi:hypothetical protein
MDRSRDDPWLRGGLTLPSPPSDPAAVPDLTRRGFRGAALTGGPPHHRGPCPGDADPG